MKNIYSFKSLSDAEELYFLCLMTETAFEPFTLDLLLAKPGKTICEESQFSCFSTDIKLHQKVSLQDADVRENIKIRFCKLSGILTDSVDIGHTNLVLADMHTEIGLQLLTNCIL